jgi:drug/metabolite transporter (DMT)-like permease
LFAILCLVWGGNWLAQKVAVETVPPAFFSGVRWTAAGIILIALQRLRHQRMRYLPRLLPRLTLISIVMIGLNATAQLYGLRYVDAGLASVINAAVTPICMLGLAVGAGQERLSWNQVIAIVIGVVGVLLLFGPRAVHGTLRLSEVAGAFCICFGTLVYCIGSVAARPLMRIVPPVQMAGLTNLIGGLLLLVFSLPLEPGAWEAARFAWGWAAWIAWIWMVLAASLGATIIYFLLVRDWGASRTGMQAFVTPVIAVLLGMAILGERVGALEALGMALLLGGAALALRRA